MITPTNPVALLDLALYPNPFIVLAMIRPNLCSSLKKIPSTKQRPVRAKAYQTSNMHALSLRDFQQS